MYKQLRNKPSIPRLVKTLEGLTYPLFAAPAFRGQRIIIRAGMPLRGNLGQLENRMMRSILNGLPPFDGILTVGSVFDPETPKRSLIHAKRIDSMPEFRLWVYDLLLSADLPFGERLPLVVSWSASVGDQTVVAAPWVRVDNHKQATEHATEWTNQGIDGIWYKDPDGQYLGRKTLTSEQLYVEYTPTESAPVTGQQKAGRISAAKRADRQRVSVKN